MHVHTDVHTSMRAGITGSHLDTQSQCGSVSVLSDFLHSLSLCPFFICEPWLLTRSAGLLIPVIHLK